MFYSERVLSPALGPESPPSPLSDPSNTDKTKLTVDYGYRVFREYCQQKGVADVDLVMGDELARLLECFYMEARTRDGVPFSANSLVVIRYAINRYYRSPQLNRQLDIVRDPTFHRANQTFKAIVRRLHREERERGGPVGGGRTPRAPPPIADDLRKLRHYFLTALNTPRGLLQKVWFDLAPHLISKSADQVHTLSKFHYRLITPQSTWDGHLPGVYHIEPDGSEVRVLVERPGDLLCPVRSFQLYLEHLHPGCQTLFQRPKDQINSEDHVWYLNGPLGKTILSKMMGHISRSAGLSRVYSNARVWSMSSSNPTTVGNPHDSNRFNNNNDHQPKNCIPHSAVVSSAAAFPLINSTCPPGFPMSLMSWPRQPPAFGSTTELLKALASATNGSMVSSWMQQHERFRSSDDRHTALTDLKQQETTGERRQEDLPPPQTSPIPLVRPKSSTSSINSNPTSPHQEEEICKSIEDEKLNGEEDLLSEHEDLDVEEPDNGEVKVDEEDELEIKESNGDKKCECSQCNAPTHGNLYRLSRPGRQERWFCSLSCLGLWTSAAQPNSDEKSQRWHCDTCDAETPSLSRHNLVSVDNTLKQFCSVACLKHYEGQTTVAPISLRNGTKRQWTPTNEEPQSPLEGTIFDNEISGNMKPTKSSRKNPAPQKLHVGSVEEE